MSCAGSQPEKRVNDERPRARDWTGLGVVRGARLAIFLMVACAAGNSLGQEAVDRVWHQPPKPTSADSGWLPRPLVLTSGKISEIEAGIMRLQNEGSVDSQVVTLDRIVWIEPAWETQQAVDGMAQFQAGKFAESIPLLLQAVEARPSVLQQQLLSSHLAIAAYEAEKFPAVFSLVDQLTRTNPPLVVVGMLPIRWTSRSISASATVQARQAIDSSNPYVRLVAASWLLSSPDDRALAERALGALAGDRTNREVSGFAEVLKWRRMPIPRIAELAGDWITQVDQLPIALQAGPLLTIADRLQAAGEKERAAELFLAVELLHKRPRTMVDQARQELVALGQGAE
jgi:thioredoxin-like negative regulator of GroEL